jgi:alkylhydroperoxidase family enzyme
MDINASRGMQDGATEAKVADIARFRESPHFSDREKAALEYAEQVTRASADVSDELFDRVRRHFNEPEIVELTATIAMENFRSKFNAPLKIEAQGFCPIPVDPGRP